LGGHEVEPGFANVVVGYVVSIVADPFARIGDRLERVYSVEKLP